MPGSALCLTCTSQNLRSALTPPLATNRQLGGWRISQIAAGKKYCTFCSFLNEILIHCGVLDEPNARETFGQLLQLTLFGNEDEGQPSSDEDVYLSVGFYEKESVCRVHIYVGGYGEAQASILHLHPVNSFSRSDMPFEDQPAQGRLISKTVDQHLLRRWFECCKKSHDHDSKIETIQEPNRPMSSRPSVSQFRLIDVVNECVVEADRSFVYICLSYVWGEAKPLRLSSANMKRLVRPGGLGRRWADVPRTFRDAISVSKAIGVRYVWIDALCIQHDDKKNLAHQIGNMDLIYRDAVLTIVSVTSNANSSIPGVHQNSRDIKTIQFEDGDMKLVCARPSLADAIRGSAWESRGWTLQEKFFSKRLLVFTQNQVYYKCRDAIWAEDTATEHLSPIVSDSASVTTEVSGRIVYFPDERSDLGNLLDYMDLLQEYTTRRLTHDTDILAAFSGILAYFAPQLGPNIMGLPERVIDSALLWKWPQHELVPRRSGFPSWSWCGWKVGHSRKLEWLIAGWGRKHFALLLKGGATPKYLNNNIGVLERGEQFILRSRSLEEEDVVFKDALGSNWTHMLLFYAPVRTLYIGCSGSNLNPWKPHDVSAKDYCSLFTGQDMLKKIGEINLAEEWRNKFPNVMTGTFLHMSTSRVHDSWYKRRHGTYALPSAPGSHARNVQIWNLMLVETDKQGLSRRIQVCDITSFSADDSQSKPELTLIKLV